MESGAARLMSGRTRVQGGITGPNETGRRASWGKEKQELAEHHAALMVVEELSRRRWVEDELKRRRKCYREKVKTAALLRRETTMALKWSAERLYGDMDERCKLPGNSKEKCQKPGPTPE